MPATIVSPNDDRGRHGQQAYIATTLGQPLEASAGAAPMGSVLEATYQANIQVPINCDASMEGVVQLFTLPKGVWIGSGITIEGAAGIPVAAIVAYDPIADNAKTLFIAKALGSTENALVVADTPIDVDDTENNNELRVTVTGAAGGQARVALSAGVALTGWK